MKINVNSKEQETAAKNIGELVAEMGLKNTKIAVAKDSKMITKDLWNSTELTDGSNILIIKAVCGG